MANEDILIKVGADFSGVEKEIKELQAQLDRLAKPTSGQRSRSGALGEVRGAGAAVSKAGAAKGTISTRRQAELFGLEQQVLQATGDKAFLGKSGKNQGKFAQGQATRVINKRTAEFAKSLGIDAGETVQYMQAQARKSFATARTAFAQTDGSDAALRASTQTRAAAIAASQDRNARGQLGPAGASSASVRHQRGLVNQEARLAQRISKAGTDYAAGGKGAAEAGTFLRVLAGRTNEAGIATATATRAQQLLAASVGTETKAASVAAVATEGVAVAQKGLTAVTRKLQAKYSALLATTSNAKEYGRRVNQAQDEVKQKTQQVRDERNRGYGAQGFGALNPNIRRGPAGPIDYNQMRPLYGPAVPPPRPPVPPKAPKLGGGAPDPGQKGFLGGIDFKRGLTSSIQYGLPAAALYGGIGALSGAFKTAQELEVEFGILENQLENIGALGDTSFSEVRESIEDIAVTTGQSVVEFAKLERQLFGAFSALDEQNNPELTKIALPELVDEQSRAGGKLAEVVGLPLTEITDGLTAASIAWDTTFESMGDTVVTLEEQTGVLGKELVNFVGDIAPVAEAAGFEMEEIAIIAAQVQQRSGRTGTVLAEQFGRILPAVSQSKEELYELAAANDVLNRADFLQGIETGDVQQTLSAIAEEFDNLSKASQDDVVALLGGRREASALLPAFASSDQAAELEQAIAGGAGALDSRFEGVFGTLRNTFERIGQELTLLFVDIFENGFKDALKAIATALETAAKAIRGIATAVGKVNDLFGGWISNLVIMAALYKGIAASSALIAKTSLGTAVAGAFGRGKAGQLPFPKPTLRQRYDRKLSKLPQQTGAVRPAARRGAGFGGAVRFHARNIAGAGPAARGPVGTTLRGRAGAAAGAAGAALKAGPVGKLGAGALAAFGGPVGIGIAALAATAITVNKYAGEWEKDLQEFSTELQTSERSARSLEAEAKRLEGTEENTPGTWAQIAAFFTGEDLLTKADIARAAAVQKSSKVVREILGSDFGLDDAENALLAEPADEVNGALGGLTSLGLDDDEVRGTVRIPGAEQFGLIQKAIDEQDEEQLKRIQAIIAHEGFGDIALEDITLENAALAVFTQEYAGALPEDLLEKLDDRLLTVNTLKDKFGITLANLDADIAAVFEGDPADIISSLREITENKEGKYEDYQVVQAGEVLTLFETNFPLVFSDELAVLADEFAGTAEGIAQTVAQVKQDFDLGLVAASEYVAAVTKASDDLQALIDDGNSDPVLKAQAAAAAQDALEATSEKAVREVEAFLNSFERRGDTSSGAVNQQLARLNSVLQSGDLTTDDESAMLDAYYGLLIDRQSALADAASTDEEADAIRAEINSASAAITRLTAENTIATALGRDFSKFRASLAGGIGTMAYGSIGVAESAIDAIIDGLVAGGEFADAAEAELHKMIQVGLKAIQTAQARITAINASLAFLSGLGAGDSEQAGGLKFEAGVAEENVRVWTGQIDEAYQALNLGDALEGAGDFSVDGGSGGGGADDVKETIFDIKRANLALEKAVNEGNEVALAGLDLQDALNDMAEAETTDELSDNIQAEASRVAALKRIENLRKERAKRYRQATANLLSAQGFNVEAAEEEVTIALEEYAEAVGRFGSNSLEAREAQVAVANALTAARDALEKRKDDFVAVLLSLANTDRDPVAQIQAEIALATQALNAANGTDERLSAQRRLLDAQSQMEDVMSDLRASQLDLWEAEISLYDSNVKNSQAALYRAQELLNEAVSQGQGEAAINRAQAGLITANKAASDARLDESRSQYDFLYQMEEITRSQYISYLESLKSALRPGTERFRELELAIKGLKDDISGDLQTNLPSNLDLPTLYEARRLGQTSPAETGGSGIGYQDNRNVQVYVTVDGEMNEQQFSAAFSSALGLGQNGVEPKVY